YGSLDAIMAHASEIGGVVGENLRQALSWLPVARRLVTIKTDCDLSAVVPDFDRALLWNKSDTATLASLRRQFQLDRSLRDIPMDSDSVADQTHHATASGKVLMSNPGASSAGLLPAGENDPGLFEPEVSYITVSDLEGLDRLMMEITQAELTALDTETTSLDPRQAQLVGMSFATGVGRAFYLPLGHSYTGVQDQLPMSQVITRLRPWLENPAALKVGQNLKYDAHILASVGVTLRGIAHDTLLESYVWEAHRPHDLDALALRHLGRKGLSYDEVTGRGAGRISFDQVTVEVATRYSCEDADFTLHLHQVLWQQLQQDPMLRKIYLEIEIPVSKVLFRMERTGIRIDSALLIEQSEELAGKISLLEVRAHDLAGQRFNLGSPRQIGDILFGKLGYSPVKKTASGAPSTDEDVLEKLAEDYPLPQVLLEWRSLSKLRSTYTEKLPRLADPTTGRVHTTFSQAVAVTGRLASSDPNLQNIPVRTPEGRRIRQAFIADDDHLLVSADYSQIELRIMAHLSQDAGLMAAFMAGEDVHKATASEVFGVGLSEVTAEQRRVAKVINFGLIYGMSAFGLARNLGIDRQVARNYIDRYFIRYPGVAHYMEETRLIARSRGYVETAFGRRLWLPEINSPNGPRRQAAERAAINAPMQGTAADLIKMAMIAVQSALDDLNLKSRIVLQVHDELVLEVPQSELDAVERLLPEKMEGIAELRVPLIVDVGRGKNWDEAH
ncbi:MAG: DNA polymerase I, partial [Methylobacterium sp.]|nr:DNA polymerase I [Methylobacterium sp.]